MNVVCKNVLLFLSFLVIMRMINESLTKRNMNDLEIQAVIGEFYLSISVTLICHFMITFCGCILKNHLIQEYLFGKILHKHVLLSGSLGLVLYW